MPNKAFAADAKSRAAEKQRYLRDLNKREVKRK